MVTTMMESVSAWVQRSDAWRNLLLVSNRCLNGKSAARYFRPATLGTGITFARENEQLRSWVDALGLNSVQDLWSPLLSLAELRWWQPSGNANILLVIAGLALIGVAVTYTAQSGMMQDWAETLGLSRAAQFITAALLIAGFALVCIGVVSGTF